MKTRRRTSTSKTTRRLYPSGKVGWILLWLIGIPVPVLLGLFLIRGCT